MAKYRDKNGTTRVGDALRWLVKQGKEVAPELIQLAGNITGIDSLKQLSKKIKESDKLSEIDKQILLEELRYDMLEMQEVTKRWQYDMSSDSWLSKNIRPLTLAFLTATLFIYIILDSSIQGFKIDDNWIDLLSSLLLLVYGGYFGARTVEKVVKHRK
jgi:predicted RNA-binding protein